MCKDCEELTRRAGCDASGVQLTNLHITGSVSILQLGAAEGSHVDIAETGFRFIREDGEVELVEVGGSGGRVIRRATDDEAR